MADCRRKVIKILEKNGCTFVRHATGSHDPSRKPISGTRFVVQHDLSSKVAANGVLKQAGVAERV